MEPVQLIIILFAGFALSRSVLRFKHKEISGKELIFWSVVWITGIIVAILPGMINFLSRPLGINRGIDLFTYFSIILLFYLVFRLYVKNEKINQDVTLLVREIAKKK